MKEARFSVVIPAHNEASVISKCLEQVYTGSTPDNRPEVIVIANGCSDSTADIARRTAPEATVIEIQGSSKTQAMNTGRARASYFPQVFLDADVQCNFRTLHALSKALRNSTALAACPRPHIDLSHASWSVRAYYQVWLRQPFAKNVLGGAGCFALSQEALSRIGPFPEVVADDFWAMSRFARRERLLVSKDDNDAPVHSYIFPPRFMVEQIRVEARRRIGNEQVKRDFPSPHLIPTGAKSLVNSAFANDASWIDACTFLSMKLASKILAEWRKIRGKSQHWVRDVSSRQR